MEFVQAKYVPMLTELDTSDNYSLVPKIVEIGSKQKGKETTPITINHGHLHLEWNAAEVLYTARELQKWHLHFPP